MPFPPAPGETFDFIPHRELACEDLAKCVLTFPGLLWRTETALARIEFLNNHRVECLGDKTSLLLRSAEFRKTAVEEQDLPLVEA